MTSQPMAFAQSKNPSSPGSRPVGVKATIEKNATTSQKKCSVAGSFGRRSRTDAATAAATTPTSARE